jgi:hypothetical protein
MPRAKHAQGYSAARACTLSTYLITQAAPELQAQLECLDRLPHLLAAKPGRALSPIDGPPAAASTATVRSGRLAPDAMRWDGMGSAGAVGSAPLPQSNGARRAETGTSPRHSAPTAVSTRWLPSRAGRGGADCSSGPTRKGRCGVTSSLNWRKRASASISYSIAKLSSLQRTRSEPIPGGASHHSFRPVSAAWAAGARRHTCMRRT